jgi:hypothetical protein
MADPNHVLKKSKPRASDEFLSVRCAFMVVGSKVVTNAFGL